MEGVTDTISELTYRKNLSMQPWEWRIKMHYFCTILEMDTTTEMTNENSLFLGFTGTNQMKTILSTQCWNCPVRWPASRRSWEAWAHTWREQQTPHLSWPLKTPFFTALAMTIKMLLFCTVWSWTPSRDDQWKTPLSTVGFTGIDHMKTILIYTVLELSGEVTSLKTELGSVGTDMKGVTDTISELTYIRPLSMQLWQWKIKMCCFCTILELDTIIEMTNGKLQYLGFTGIDHMKTILIYT